MKLYKFRSISDKESLKRAADIVVREKLWFSSLWEQNDSLEGVYLSNSADGDGIFNGKDQFKICSFSGEKALREPMMWAHYANGFKGVAVEIDVVQAEDFRLLTYSDEPIRVAQADGISGDVTSLVREIVTRKTMRWAYEAEIRCLRKKAKAGAEFVGSITGVYFGAPYKGISNRKQVIDSSEKLGAYHRLRRCLEVAAVRRGLKCFEAYLAHGTSGAEVRIDELPRPTNAGQNEDLNLTDE